MIKKDRLIILIKRYIIYIMEEKNFEPLTQATLPCDLYLKGNNFVLLAPIPGVKPQEIEIHVTENSLKIKGRREKIEKVEEDNYFFQECFWGEFERTLKLPLPINIEKVKAEIKDGFLKITLPRKTQTQTKIIKI